MFRNATMGSSAQFLSVYNSTASDADKLAAAKVFFQLHQGVTLSKADINMFKPETGKAQAEAFLQAYQLLRRQLDLEDLTSIVVSDASDTESFDDYDVSDDDDLVAASEPNETPLKDAVQHLFFMMDDVEEEDKIQQKLNEIRSLLVTYQAQFDDLLQMLHKKKTAYESTGLIIAEFFKNAFNTLERSFLCVKYLNENALEKAWQQDQDVAEWVLAQRSNANGPTTSIPVNQGAAVTSRVSRSHESQLLLPAKISDFEQRVSNTTNTTHITTLFLIRKMQIECLAEYIKNPAITQTLQTRLLTSKAALTERFDYAMKRAHEKDKVFYMPLLQNMAFFDKYLLDQVCGKKKHASSRINYCIAFMKNVTVEYDSNKMDQPLIELLKNLYRLKGLLLCEAHSQVSYLASLFHCAMTSVLAKHVTSEISKIEVMLKEAQQKKSRVGARGNLARISDIDIDANSDIKAKRDEIQALNRAYGTRWRRFKTALFNAKPALTTQAEKDLVSAWHSMTPGG